MGKRFVLAVLAGTAGSVLFVAPAFAHVIVTPKQADVGTTQEFTMSVPTEKPVPTISIKLEVPAGVSEVIPNATPGWTITEQQSGDRVTEIDWSAGSIPVGQRQDFLFQAQVPPQATTLKWKAYQQYQDGSIVAWVNTPTSNPEDDSAPPPYSTTRIVNDLTGTAPASNQSQVLPLTIGGAALVISLIALAISLSGKK